MNYTRLVYFCVLITLSLLAFLYSFFPIKQHVSSVIIEQPKMLNDLELNLSIVYKPQIERLIIIVIDALRTDFVTSKYMPFLTSAALVDGCTTKLKVEAPTVTLPRIKALTTGAVPQFSDVLFNLASTEVLEVSLLHEAKVTGRKLVFYGDDTWLKLYPDIFDRHEGVSSFYVYDYTECDTNVTQNVIFELDKPDWDIMVLHYLGLDHIGHVFGPFSSLVPQKLTDMDSLVQKIYEKSQSWNKRTLIAVTGDHGMKDSGGHGGSTTAEIYVPFTTLGIHCNNGTGAQTDVTPTLAALLGLPFPKNSVGSLLSNLLVNVPAENLLYSLYYNNLVLNAKLQLCHDMFTKAVESHYQFLKNGLLEHSLIAQKLYENCSTQISDRLVRSSTNQKLPNLMLFVALLLLSTWMLLHHMLVNTFRDLAISHICCTIILFCLLFSNTCFLRLLIWVVVLYFTLKDARFLVPRVSVENLLVTVFIILHLISLTSSSFIEEEHQTMYFFWTTISLLYTLRALKVSKATSFYFFALAVGLRILRTLNQTGDKWAHLPDLADWLLEEANSLYLHVLLLMSLITIWILMEKTLLIGMTLAVIFIFRIYKDKEVIFGQCTWFLIFINLGIDLKYSVQPVITHIKVAWVLICTLLQRPHNVVLIPACLSASLVLTKQIKRKDILMLTHVLLGNVLFFCQGHGNSLATIDVAAGYVGLRHYIPAVVFAQVFCHTYTFPILVNLLVIEQSHSQLENIWAIAVVYKALVLSTTTILTYVQSDHLFVWTVFAPKLLIESSHFIVLVLQVVICYVFFKIELLFGKVKNKIMYTYLMFVFKTL